MSISTADTGLVIVDMQRYYLDPRSSFFQYSTRKYRRAMEYISDRCRHSVIPNIVRLIDFFRQQQLPIVYLRLCSQDISRRDLHPFFQETNLRAENEGFSNVYPMAGEPMAQIVPELSPQASDLIIDKGTFSAFTRTDFEEVLRSFQIERLIFTGLATSQCVDTTARDASDRGFEIVHIEDAQADYDENSHNASLYASFGVCGGRIYSTEEYLNVAQPQRV